MIFYIVNFLVTYMDIYQITTLINDESQHSSTYDA